MKFQGCNSIKHVNYTQISKLMDTNQDYCNYELALALKKAGFDWECDHYYTKEDAPDGQVWFLPCEYGSDDYNAYRNWVSPQPCSAPLLYQAQKWLRETKGIAINVIAHDCSDKHREGKYHWMEVHLPNSNENGPQWMDWFIYSKHPLFDTYEEALSDGIANMLRLLDNKKK